MTTNKIISFLILTTLLIVTSCKKEDFTDVYQEPGYAIGVIDSYKSHPFKVTYYYNFEVNGVDHTGEEVAKGIGQFDERLLGNSYLVVYKMSNISENDLNFNYSIENKQEFLDLVDSFENNPPDID